MEELFGERNYTFLEFVRATILTKTKKGYVKAAARTCFKEKFFSKDSLNSYGDPFELLDSELHHRCSESPKYTSTI